MRPQVLIADDDPLVRRLLAMLAGACGAECVEADNGLQALAFVERKRYDLVLLDLMMPVLDGAATLARLRQLPGAPPVLIVTGHADPLIEQRLAAAGAAGWLQKPLQPTEVQRTLRRFLTC